LAAATTASITADVADAVRVLRDGGVVAYPTEAVYGLGCLADSDEALRRLCEIKGRDQDRGLILIGADLSQLRPFLVELDPEVEARVLARWPGPTTWVLPAAAGLSPIVTGGRDTVAVRVPGSAIARELCATLGTAITSTSANRHGEPPARDANAVHEALGETIDLLLDGQTDGMERPSEIRDGMTGTVLRAGGGS
jgi:L-threonylcarbamoyladenylate synthase